MTALNNPLKQYFRRPAVYLSLPSKGKFYQENVIETTPTGELPVFPMTAIDEITMKTPDALFNGVAMAELIKSCIPSIKDPWAINNIDFDAILIAIRAAEGKNEMEIDSQCPSCSEVNSYGLNLLSMLSSITSGDFDNPLQINDLKVKFKPITYKQMNEASLIQLEVQKEFIQLESTEDQKEKNEKQKELIKKLTTTTMKLLTEAIEYIETPTTKVEEKEFIYDFLINCDKGTYLTVRDYNVELKGKSEIKPLQVKCPNCSHEYNQPFTLNVSDFFG
jgi:rRNA maturation endonuclease Nob1